MSSINAFKHTDSKNNNLILKVQPSSFLGINPNKFIEHLFGHRLLNHPTTNGNAYPVPPPRTSLLYAAGLLAGAVVGRSMSDDDVGLNGLARANVVGRRVTAAQFLLRQRSNVHRGGEVKFDARGRQWRQGEAGDVEFRRLEA